MPKKVREAIATVKEDGWQEDSMNGSHRHFTHRTKPGKVTIPGHEGDDLPPGTWSRILRQAQITKEQLERMGRRRKGRKRGR